VCVFIFLTPEIRSFKKEMVKQQDSNLEYFSYESGILALQPTPLRNTKSLKFN